MQCDYSAVNAVKKAQEDIWNACMAADQWVLRFSTDGYGGNTEGGLFSPFIAKTPSGHYSIITKFGLLLHANPIKDIMQ